MTKEFAQLEQLLTRSFAQQGPSDAFTARLRARLANQQPLPVPLARRRPKLAWAFALLLLALALTVLAIGPRKVLAQFGRWFGFLPNYGFIQSSEPLAIGQTVYQDSPDGRVSLASGFADAEQTLLRLAFDREAKAPTRVWLEGSSSQVLNLAAWAFTPDQPGSRGLELRFGPLAGGTSGWLLRSDAGWKLPLYWQPASSSQVLQPNLLASPSVPPDPTALGPDLRHCIARQELMVCLSAVSVAGDQISLLLESPLSDAGRLHAQLFDQFTDPDQPERQPHLRDARGTLIPLTASGRSESGGFSAYTLTGTLTEGFQAEGALALSFPALQYRLPLDAVLKLQIPEDLQDGDSFSLDQNLELGSGQLHFSSAQLKGSRLFISSEPFRMAEGTQFLSIELSKPERVDDLYGTGRELTPEGTRARIMVELNQGSGRLSGELSLPVVGAYILWQNPDEIRFNISELPEPAATPAPSPVPGAALDDSLYPAALPLTWHQQETSSGSLLYLGQDSKNTRVYQASARDGFRFSPWLEAPGQIAALKLVPELQGVAFILGVNDQNPDWVFRQTSLNALYFAPFGQDARRIALLSPYTVEAAWHPDGENLALLIREEGPGHSYTSKLQLINLADGSIAEHPLGAFWTDWLSWSNAGDLLALRQLTDTSGGSRADILVISPQQDQPSARNIRAGFSSPLYLGGPLMWLGDDHALVALCEESSLCQANLDAASPRVIAAGLDLGLVRSGLAAQRWFPRFTHSREDAETHLMAYDLLTSADQELFSIPTGEATKSQWGMMDLAPSPWNGLLAVYTSERGLDLFELPAGKHWQSALPELLPEFWTRGQLIWTE